MGSLPSYLPFPYLPIDGDQPKEGMQEGHKLMPTVLKNLSIHFTNYLFSTSITQVTKKNVWNGCSKVIMKCLKPPLSQSCKNIA